MIYLPFKFVVDPKLGIKAESPGYEIDPAEDFRKDDKRRISCDGKHSEKKKIL